MFSAAVCVQPFAFNKRHTLQQNTQWSGSGVPRDVYCTLRLCGDNCSPGVEPQQENAAT